MIIASCPVCGKVLFKGAPNSQIEGGCSKCGEYIKIEYRENGFQAVAVNYNPAVPQTKKAGKNTIT